jgi:hypothetical protein
MREIHIKNNIYRPGTNSRVSAAAGFRLAEVYWAIYRLHLL